MSNFFVSAPPQGADATEFRVRMLLDDQYLLSVEHPQRDGEISLVDRETLTSFLTTFLNQGR